MANIPADLRYTKDHEYVKQTGDDASVQIGITDYAQGELGDVVYVDLPKVGAVFGRGDVFGTIEAVKGVSEQIGKASCRGRGEISVVAGSLKKKKYIQ